MSFHAYLFTDGSSSMKEDIGGWAAIAVSGKDRKVLFGSEFPTTISRCELLPIINGLRWIKSHWATSEHFKICVCSDSEYTVKTISGVYPATKNLELWNMLEFVAKGLDVTYIWRERNSLQYMTLCDALCGVVRRTLVDKATEWSPGDPRAIEKILPEIELPVELTEETK